MIQYLSVIDLVVPPLLLMVIFFVTNSRRVKNIETNPSYRYYIPGLLVKLAGGTAVCIIYVVYYGGGDTLNYYNDNTCIANLFLKDPSSFFDFLLGPKPEMWWRFDSETGFPIYLSDKHAIVVVKLTWLLGLITFKSFIGQTLLLAWISYWPIWRMYQMFIHEFPKLTSQLAFAILFIPSVFFWGSGLLKDTITFAAVCLFTSSFSLILTRGKDVFKNLFLILIASLLLIYIKPYIFFALLPGSILWFAGVRISKVDNQLIKSMTTPLIIFISLISGYLMLRQMSVFLGEYALENVLEKAVVTNQDLKNERYQGSSFDIGDFDPTIPGILSKMPAAINATLFRPYLWEANNLAMTFSGIENFVLLAMTIYILLLLRVYNLFRLMFRHRILFFTIFFSLFFAFAVGLTTSNFGSLVRYKIPAIPFFVISLFIIFNTYRDLQSEDRERALSKEKD